MATPEIPPNGGKADSEDPSTSGAQNPKPVDPWPKVDPEAIQDKQFMTAGDVPGGQVAITARNGPVQKHGAPSGLFARLVEQVGDTIKQVGNLATPPLVIRAEALASMTIVFGEPMPEPEPDQARMPYHAVWRSSETIARLINLDEDAVFDFAMDVGAGASAYADLARLVESEGITLEWEVRGVQPQTLTTDLAARHYQRLAKPPDFRERSMMIEGLLYGVIYEGRGHGRARIRLSKGSPLPPRRHGRTVIVEYETKEIEDQIIHSLIGEPVLATVRVGEPTPRTSVLPPEAPYAVVESIERGGNYNMQELFTADEDNEADS